MSEESKTIADFCPTERLSKPPYYESNDQELYHFTCTARLPWIVAAKKLRPGRNQIGGFPSPDSLWATTRRQGDRTASGMQGYRKGVTALVRLTLFAEDFEAWPAITARFPQWTIKHVRQLETAAERSGERNFECWRARAEPLPLSRVIGAEAKTYTGRWRAIELAYLQHLSNPALRGIILNGLLFTPAHECRATWKTAPSASRGIAPPRIAKERVNEAGTNH